VWRDVTQSGGWKKIVSEESDASVFMAEFKTHRIQK
jgi:hypothetical protein